MVGCGPPVEKTVSLRGKGGIHTAAVCGIHRAVALFSDGHCFRSRPGLRSVCFGDAAEQDAPGSVSIGAGVQQNAGGVPSACGGRDHFCDDLPSFFPRFLDKPARHACRQAWVDPGLEHGHKPARDTCANVAASHGAGCGVEVGIRGKVMAFHPAHGASRLSRGEAAIDELTLELD